MLDRAITDYVASAPQLVKKIPGQLSDREIRFLALMGACPLAEGEILSIGCGLGQSAIVFAEAARLAGDTRVS
ncbi:MAG: hypothetical protein H6823_26240, partial [Planctomycetaceae bacterium]|nr:hypothetical protein [Planctomycetaceae bacterium]